MPGKRCNSTTWLPSALFILINWPQTLARSLQLSSFVADAAVAAAAVASECSLLWSPEPDKQGWLSEVEQFWPHLVDVEAEQWACRKE